MAGEPKAKKDDLGRYEITTENYRSVGWRYAAIWMLYVPVIMVAIIMLLLMLGDGGRPSIIGWVAIVGIMIAVVYPIFHAPTVSAQQELLKRCRQTGREVSIDSEQGKADYKKMRAVMINSFLSFYLFAFIALTVFIVISNGL